MAMYAKSLPTALAMSLLLLSASIQAAPRVQTGPDAELTFDGLHRVDKTRMDAARVKPDLDLTPYEKFSCRVLASPIAK